MVASAFGNIFHSEAFRFMARPCGSLLSGDGFCSPPNVVTTRNVKPRSTLMETLKSIGLRGLIPIFGRKELTSRLLTLESSVTEGNQSVHNVCVCQRHALAIGINYR